MAKISNNMLSDFWFENFISPNHHCGICGNWGVIDTRGKVFTPAGVECGIRTYCLCPNGQVMKRGKAKL